MSRMLDAALRYAAMGWHVFPLATTGDIKAPHPSLEHGHREATVDETVVRRWWTRYPTAGIGVSLARSGLIAVDIDPRNGGLETLARLEEEYGPLDSVVTCISGSGGEHRYFLPPDGLRSAPGHLGPRGGGVDLKYQGYVVAPPSPWAPGRDVAWQEGGPRYRWAPGAEPFGGRADFLTRIPEWALQHRGPARTPATEDEDDPFVEVAPIVGLSVDAMRAILADIDSDNYEIWLQVLAGIYHETGGSAEGRDLAEEWSLTSSKFESDKFDRTWRSLAIEGKGRAPTTFRYALKLSKEAREKRAAKVEQDARTAIVGAMSVPALKGAAAAVKPLDLDPIVREALTAAVRDRYKALTGSALSISLARDLTRYERPDLGETPAWLRGWVYCARDDRFFRVGTEEALTQRAFDSLFAVKLLTKQDRAEGRAVPEIRPSDAALNRYEIQRVHGRMYLPGEGLFFTFHGSRYMNTYSAARQPPVPAEWSAEDRAAAEIVARHMAHLIPDDRDRGLVLSWLCSIVQGGPRPNWAVVIQGPEGDGKSFLSHLMGAVLGSTNVAVIAAPTIQESPFNGWAEGSQVSVIEEIKQHSQNRHVVLDRLQPLITNDVIQIHRKGVDPYTARNTAAYLLLTNHRDALPIGSGDTRYFMVASPRQSKTAVAEFTRKNPGYFVRLYGVLNDRPGAVRKWMLEYPMAEEFNPLSRAPRSLEHDHAARLARPELFEAIDDLLDASSDPLLSRNLLVVDRLAERLTEQDYPVVPQALGRALLTMGFTMIGRVKDGAGRRRTVWSTDPGRFGSTTGERETVVAKLLTL